MVSESLIAIIGIFVLISYIYISICFSAEELKSMLVSFLYKILSISPMIIGVVAISYLIHISYSKNYLYITIVLLFLIIYNSYRVGYNRFKSNLVDIPKIRS